MCDVTYLMRNECLFCSQQGYLYKIFHKNVTKSSCVLTDVGYTKIGHFVNVI